MNIPKFLALTLISSNCLGVSVSKASEDLPIPTPPPLIRQQTMLPDYMTQLEADGDIPPAQPIMLMRQDAYYVERKEEKEEAPASSKNKGIKEDFLSFKKEYNFQLQRSLDMSLSKTKREKAEIKVAELCQTMLEKFPEELEVALNSSVKSPSQKRYKKKPFSFQRGKKTWGYVSDSD